MDLDEWITDFGPSVLHFAFSRLLDRTEAEDVFQEVFIHAYVEAPATLKHPNEVKSWLLAVTANACRDRARWWKRRQRRLVFAEQPDTLDERTNVERTVMTRMDNEVLWRRILSLAPRLREVIILHYFEDLGIREVAKILGCSEQAVKNRLHRARRSLESILPKEEGYRER